MFRKNQKKLTSRTICHPLNISEHLTSFVSAMFFAGISGSAGANAAAAGAILIPAMGICLSPHANVGDKKVSEFILPVADV